MPSIVIVYKEALVEKLLSLNVNVTLVPPWTGPNLGLTDSNRGV